MGMYDYFVCDTSCPVCGNYLIEPYQTKSFECLMDVYRPGNKVFKDGNIHVYNHCSHNIFIDKIEDGMLFTKNKAVWIEYEIPIIKRRIPIDQNTWKLVEIKEVDFNGITFIPDGITNEDIVFRYLKFNHKMENDIKSTAFEKQKYNILDLLV